MSNNKSRLGSHFARGATVCAAGAESLLLLSCSRDDAAWAIAPHRSGRRNGRKAEEVGIGLGGLRVDCRDGCRLDLVDLRLDVGDVEVDAGGGLDGSNLWRDGPL